MTTEEQIEEIRLKVDYLLKADALNDKIIAQINKILDLLQDRSTYQEITTKELKNLKNP